MKLSRNVCSGVNLMTKTNEWFKWEFSHSLRFPCSIQYIPVMARKQKTNVDHLFELITWKLLRLVYLRLHLPILSVVYKRFLSIRTYMRGSKIGPILLVGHKCKRSKEMRMFFPFVFVLLFWCLFSLAIVCPICFG